MFTLDQLRNAGGYIKVDNVTYYDPRYCINCSFGDSTPATHDPIGVGPKCCYDNGCDSHE